MKWLFLAAIFGLVPVLTGWLRTNRRNAPILWTTVGLLPLITAPLHLYVAPISWAMWPGYVKGIEVSLLDAVALAICLSAGRDLRQVRMRTPLVLYLCVVAFAVPFSDVPMGGAVLRLAVRAHVPAVHGCRGRLPGRACPPGDRERTGDRAGDPSPDRGGRNMRGGVLQTGGSFGHQNQLGMLSHFAIYPALALLLAGRKGWVPWMGPLAGVAIAIFTASRATIGLAGLGFALMFAVSALRHPTSRKFALMGGGLIVLTIAAPLAYTTLERRFAAAPLSGDYDERAAFVKAAWMMIDDHPTGVGPNQYVVAANVQGYSSRAGVIPSFGSRGANVHNAYLLAGAETGYPGMVAFALMLIWPIVVAFRAAWRNRRDPNGELLIGVGVALIVVAFHSWFEWIFVTFHTQYMFAIACGLIAGIAQQTGYWRKPVRRRVAPVHEVVGSAAMADLTVDIRQRV